MRTSGVMRAAAPVRLDQRRPDRTHRLELGGGMMPYRWTINGATFADADPLPVAYGYHAESGMMTNLGHLP